MVSIVLEAINRIENSTEFGILMSVPGIYRKRTAASEWITNPFDLNIRRSCRQISATLRRSAALGNCTVLR